MIRLVLEAAVQQMSKWVPKTISRAHSLFQFMFMCPAFDVSATLCLLATVDFEFEWPAVEIWS